MNFDVDFYEVVAVSKNQKKIKILRLSRINTLIGYRKGYCCPIVGEYAENATVQLKSLRENTFKIDNKKVQKWTGEFIQWSN